MKKENTIVTFVENNDRTKPELDSEAVAFTVPYARILQAEKFCKAEEMDHCYVGYRDFMWVIQATESRLTPCVRVTPEGLDKSESEKYLISMSKVTEPT